MKPNSLYNSTQVQGLRSTLLPRVRRLHELYQAGELGGTTHEVYPCVNKGSRENYLYFTLAASLNFQRKSEALWRSALATYKDRCTQFVFFPENVDRGIGAYRTALTKHRLALQPTRHTAIWYKISLTLRNRFGSDPRLLLREFDYDVEQVKRGLSESSKQLPYLNGPKLSNYWLYLLLCFTDVQLRRKHSISVIPDTHVIRATMKLGLLPGSTSPRPQVVAAAWHDLLAGSEFAPCDLHAALWRWSRRGFTPDV